MSTYLQPKEDKILLLPHSSVMLNLQTTQQWVPVKRFQSSAGPIGYGLRLEGDNSPSVFLLDLNMISSNFDVITSGEVLPPLSIKRALDALIDGT